MNICTLSVVLLRNFRKFLVILTFFFLYTEFIKKNRLTFFLVFCNSRNSFVSESVYLNIITVDCVLNVKVRNFHLLLHILKYYVQSVIHIENSTRLFLELGFSLIYQF